MCWEKCVHLKTFRGKVKSSLVDKQEIRSLSAGFTFMEVVIASVILALIIVTFSAVLTYQAKMRTDIATKDQAYQLMEENLKACVSSASDYYDQIQTFNGRTFNYSYYQYFQNPMSQVTLPQYFTEAPFSVQNTMTAVLTNEAYTVSLIDQNSPKYYLFQITSTVTWNGHSVTGTTLVVPELLRSNNT